MNKALIIAFTIIFSMPFTSLKSQSDYADGEEIPFGFTDLQLGFFRSHYVKYNVVASTDVNGDPSYRMDKSTGSSLFGMGLDAHLALLYTFLNRDESRFRIAEDLGIGVYGGYGVGIRAFAGVQCAFRINDVFDVGLKYYPFYSQSDYKSRVAGELGRNAFGIKARVSIVYIDYTSIKARNSDLKPTRYNEIKLRCLYDPDSEYFNNFSLIYGFANFQNPSPTNQVNLPPIYTELSNLKNKYTTIQIGWGMTF